MAEELIFLIGFYFMTSARPLNHADELRILAEQFERKWLSKVPVHHRWKWRTGRLLFPWLALWRVRREVKVRGEVVMHAFGVSPGEQFSRALEAERKLSLRADYFYRLRLYQRDRWNNAGEFLGNHQCFHLVGGLSDISPSQNGALHHDKRHFARHCHDHGIATPKPVWDTEAKEPGCLPAHDLFAKPIGNISSGSDAHRWTYCGPDRYRDSHGRELDSKGVVSHLRGLATAGRGWLLQAALSNHPSLSPLTNGALATIRVVTSRVGNRGVEWIGARLRLPVGTSAVDNYSQGNLVASVEVGSGEVSSAGFRSHELLGSEAVETHPDTGMQIQGQKVPDWSSLCALVNRAHDTCPDLPFVGWDVALCPEGPVLIEANITWGVQLMQVSADRGICNTIFAPRYLEAYQKAVRGSRSA